MYQHLTIIGNVGRDAEMTYTLSGIAVAKFTVAVNKVAGKGDEKREKVTWFRVTVWRERAETISQYVKKGMKVMVVGEIGVSAYQSKDGSPAATLELTAYDVKFLSRVNGTADPSGVEPPEDQETNDIPF